MAISRGHSFYGKLSISLLISFILIGLLLLIMVQHLTQRYQNEVEQKLHKNLAHHVVKDSALLKDGQIDQEALKNAFHNMMILGPDFEFYLLDSTGAIQTYSAEPGRVKRSHVEMAPIYDFLSGEQALPILGDDPRGLGKQKIFSVSPIYEGDVIKGYLYIIIGGEIYDGITALLKNSHNLNLAVWGLGLALVFGLVAMLLLFALLTRPLRKLTRDIQVLHQKGFQSGDLLTSTWDGDSSDEIHRLGSAFNDMANALNQQYQNVKQTDELRRELISYVSHDLRTPLAALQGYLETWKLKHERMSAAQGQALIEVALNNAQQISRLIEQLFELAYLDGADTRLEMEPVAIAELAYDTAQQFQLAADEKQVTLETHCRHPGTLVYGNIEKLERVLNNLIDNAIRHCQPGDEVVISIDGGDQCGSDGSQVDAAGLVSVQVKDTGVGIPGDEQSKVFENHYRASNAVVGKGTNSGLGLAISARVVKLHGSSLTVESTLGQGSTFRFCLPAVA